MDNNALSSSNSSHSPMTEETVKNFLSNQAREIELKEQEIILRKQADKNSFDYANKSLEVQRQDRVSHREYLLKLNMHRYIFSRNFVILGNCSFAWEKPSCT